MTEFLKNSWCSEPQYSLTVDPENPLADRLSVCVLPVAGDFDLAGREVPAITGSLTRVPGYTGTMWSGASGAYVDIGSTLSPGSVGCTALQIINPGSQVNCFSWSSRASSGADGVEFLIGPAGTAGNIEFRVAGDATGDITGLNDGREHTIIGTYTPGVSISIYADRLSNVQTVPTAIGSVSPSQNVRIHSRAATYYTGKSGLFVYWNRVLSIPEIAQLLENPWAVFTPSGIPLYLNSIAAAGGSLAKLLGGKLHNGGILINGVLA